MSDAAVQRAESWASVSASELDKRMWTVPTCPLRAASCRGLPACGGGRTLSEEYRPLDACDRPAQERRRGSDADAGETRPQAADSGACVEQHAAARLMTVACGEVQRRKVRPGGYGARIRSGGEESGQTVGVAVCRGDMLRQVPGLLKRRNRNSIRTYAISNCH